MKLNINKNWQKYLKNEFNKPYFKELSAKIEEEYQKVICYPEKDLIFAAFNQCSFDNLRVVIIGQDPYHGDGEANGLCFSVNEKIKIPPSLRNIFKEISTDFDTVFLPIHGNLASWAAQGVLLLNSTLTVEKDKPNSHKNLQWNAFTDSVIKIISDNKQGVVFLLWGNFAQQKLKLIEANKHLVLLSGHPSPMSANQGKWFGNKHFSKTNTYLKTQNLDTINWF